MSFRSMDSRPPPSPNLHRHHVHLHHHPTPDHHHHHRQPPSLHDPANYRYSSPYPSPPQPLPPSLFSSEPYLSHPIPPQPQQQSQPPKPNPNYYQFSFQDTPNHHPRCSVASNYQCFPAAAPNREGNSTTGDFSRLELDQDLLHYTGRVERGPTLVSLARPEEELLRVGRTCYGGYDNSCSGRFYGNEINRRFCELDSVGDDVEFRVGSRDYGEQEFVGRFSNERCDDSHTRRSMTGSLKKNYNVTPTKQVQKRSAFTRLQMPEIYHSPRKFDRERCYGSVYDDKNGSSPFRCKGALPCPEITVKDRRNGKSVDLDVSFKSNSLVAKAVVAPGSSTFVLDDDSSPKAKRPRSFVQSNKESDCSLSRNKFAEDLQRPNISQSMVALPTGSRLVLNKGSPSKVNRPKIATASYKDSRRLSLKKVIEQGMEKLNEFSTIAASTGLVKEKTRGEQGIVAAGSGGMASGSNANAVKSEPRNSTDEARKSVKISDADKAHPILQLKAGALSIGKGAATGPKESVAVRDKVAIPDGHLNKDDLIKSESGNEKGEGGRFKMVLKANKARRPLKKDNVLVKKSDAGNGKTEGGKVAMVSSADKADHNWQSSIKTVPVRKGSHVGPTENVSVLVDRVVTSESGEREGHLSKTNFSVADCGVIREEGEVEEPMDASKAEKSTYTGSEKSNLVVGQRVGTIESGKKSGCLNECDVSALNSEAGKGEVETGRTKKIFKADNAGPDRLPTAEVVPMRKVTDFGPKEDVRSCKDGKLALWDEGKSSGGKDASASDKAKIIGGDRSISSGAPARKIVQKNVKKKVVNKVVKKMNCCPEIHHLDPLKKNGKSQEPDHAAMIGHYSSATEGVKNACGDISSSPNAVNIALNDIYPLIRPLAKGISHAIKADANGEDDDRMNTPKQRKDSVSISQTGPSCIKETFNSASKAFVNLEAGMASNSSQNLLDFTTVSNLKTSIESCTPSSTNGEPGKVPIICKDESMSISRSDGDPARLAFSGISTPSSPGPDKGLISAQEPNLPCGPDKESIAYPSMPFPLPAPPEDKHDVLEGSSDPRCMKSSSNLEENSNVPDKYSIFEHEQQSSSKNLPLELNSGGTTGSSSVLIPDKKSEKCSVISQGAGNNTSSDEGIFSKHVAQPGVSTLNTRYSHAKVVDNSQDLTSEDALCPTLTADPVGGSHTGLTSSMHLNIQGSETVDDFSNGMVLVDTVTDVSESGHSPGKKEMKLCCSKEHSRRTSNHEHVSSLPNDDRTFFSGQQSATDDGARISGIEGGPLSIVTLNETGLSSGNRGNTSLFDDAVLPGTDNSINNSLLIQKLLNSVFLPGCSPMQNELSDPHRMGDTKEGCLASSATNDHSKEIVMEIGESKIMNAQASEKQDMDRCELAKSNCPGEVDFHTLEKNMPGLPLENQSQKSPFSTSIPCATGIEKLLNSGSSNELMEPKSHPISDRSSPEETEICLGSKVSICKALLDQFPWKLMDNDSYEQTDKLAVPGWSMNADDHPVVHDSPFNSNSVQEIQKDCPIPEKPPLVPREDFRSTELSYKGAGLPIGPKPCIPEQRAFPVRSSFISRTSKSNNSTSNSRTWHRTSNDSAFVPGMLPSPNVLPMKRNVIGGNGKLLDASYVRKGNSLVRKPTAPASHFTSSAVQKSSSSVMVEPEKENGGGKTVNNSDHRKFVISEGTVSSSERPLSPPVVSTAASPNHTSVFSEKFSTSSSAGPPVNISDVPPANPVNPVQGNHLGFSCKDTMDPQLREDLVYSASQIDMNNGTSNRILYVKPKSNKLIATKDLSDQANRTNKSEALTSSGYFKRKRNQLIRSSVGNSIAHVTSSRLVDAASEDHGPPKGLLSSWKCYQMVIPQLFPWKRVSYWRKLMKTRIGPSGRSCPASSQRLILLRKRDAVYTRSKHGLSLRRSKVLSIGGSSLKWSKSIERRSKKVNEEATRAVLEAEREKREHKASISAKTKKENNGSRGRIFRIGSQLYKMDPSRRTLQRIPDDESSKSATSGTKKLLTKFYVPRRLMIGSDEYVRIGNGNQLIRDPKKRSRLLASEKVRWSLHTARQRLAKKKKYCQFFTRFGKCNKDGGKCPYIHDPSKIAVCTKFLNGLCSNNDCKLTHKIIPERMPDCSFFLQGLCANKNCPYRHVNVNPKAPTCEAFLRGYCMDGNECRKKHSYVCPVFGATGNCPQGSKCKLHHPKAQNRGKKRKRLREKKNVRDRYFGSTSRRVLEPGAFVPEKPLSVTHGETLDLPDYIALGSSEDEAGEGDGIGSGEMVPADLLCGDGLIKPLGLRELDMTT